MKLAVFDQSCSRPFPAAVKRVSAAVAGLWLATASLVATGAVTTTGEIVPLLPGTLTVGSSQPGSLQIDGGSVVTQADPSFGASTVYLGLSPGGVGTGTVTGAGSQWAMSTLYVGNSGIGSLSALSGGVVSSGSLLAGGPLGDGTLIVDGVNSKIQTSGFASIGVTTKGRVDVSGGGLFTSGLFSLAANSGAEGIATVSGAGSRIAASGVMTVGLGPETGATVLTKGTLTISNAGVVDAYALNIARNILTDGKVTLTGSGSAITLRAPTGQQTFMNVGRVGTGQLDVLAGGKLVMDPTTPSSSTFNALNIAGPGGTVPPAGAQNSHGTMNVSGAGSEVRLKGDFSNIGVGRNGVGAMNITNGGKVIIENTTGTTFSAIGRANTATGTVLVDGANSTWQAGRRLFIASELTAATLSEAPGGGTGTLTVSNGGSVTVGDDIVIGAGGTLNGGGGTIFGDILNRGRIAPGNSPGILSVVGDVNLTSTGTLSLEIGGLTPGSGHSQFLVSGALLFGGTLKLNSWNGFVAHGGNRFQLFEWGSTSGQFGNVDLSGLALAGGASVDMSRLYLDGSITIAPVPEPMPMALWSAGIAFVLWTGVKRRRERSLQRAR